MESVQRINKTELARHTNRVIQAVQQGQTAVIESYGRPEVAVVDIIDYQIMRAVLHYYGHPSQVDMTAGLADEAVAAKTSSQERYNLVFVYYLAEAISLARAAELLDLSWLDLRTRCLRLEIPLRNAPANPTEAEADVETALSWSASTQP